MKAFAESLDRSLVARAHVDDWGRYGNFTLMVTPVTADRYATRRLTALIERSMPKGAHLRECFPPDPVIETRYGGRRKVSGYSRSFWTFDIDYQHYDSSSNTFSRA
jgi:hypothetical protein